MRKHLKKNMRLVITGLVMVGLIVGYYYYLANRDDKAPEDNVKVTELHEVLSKKLDISYPPTPREVIKFYNRILECAYNDEYDDAQFNQLAEQARKLMDDELLQNNPEDAYKMQFQKEIAAYKEDSRQIMQTAVCDSDEVESREIEGRKCAYVGASYFTKEGKEGFYRAYESYLLRQDKDGKWKILAYHLVDGEES